MLNIGGGEIALILIVALLLLGPKRMPELARGLGKFLREFRRQTDDVRTMVEREFYKMDREVQPLPPDAPKKGVSPNTTDMTVPRVVPAPGTLATSTGPAQAGEAAAGAPAATPPVAQGDPTPAPPPEKAN